MTIHNADSLVTQERFAALIERQRELEAMAMEQGTDRFMRSVARAAESGDAAHTGANKKLLTEAVFRTEAGLIALIEAEKLKRGPKHTALGWINQVGPDVAAYMTVKCVLDTLTHKQTVREVSRAISALIVDELRFRRFREQAPGLFQYRLDNFNTSSYTHMARSMTATLGHADVDVSDLEMTESTKMLVGVKLLDVLITTTGIVEFVSKRIVKRGPRPVVRQEQVLVATPETLEWITQRNNAMSVLNPVNMPMVVPPLAWEPKQRGGYRFSLRGRYSLVRGRDSVHTAQVNSANMPKVYQALNMLQETPWAINRAVLNLVNTIKANGREMAGVPAFLPEAMPPKPLDIMTNEDSRKAYRKAKHQVHERNHLREVRTLEYSHTLNVAEQFAREAAMFFPYSLDFRGRIYPISSFLTPQGGDLAKALLTFAEGKVVDGRGVFYLAVHGANLLDTTPEGYKISKASLQERADWVRAHTVEICAVARDPFGNTWWADAEKPLQFYAFCVEWAHYASAEECGVDFVSTLPVYADGSCNGIQHFSAMFRDQIGGAAVNLIPSAVPQDIYQRIANRVLEMLEETAATSEWSAKWLASGLVNRKFCKRPTMTFGYGSKRYGFADQIRDFLKAHKDWQTIRAMFTEADGKLVLHDAVGHMAQLIWDSLGDTVVAAAAGMDWMQEAVARIVVTGNAVGWTVPGTNFPVRQHYFEFKVRQVKTILAGKVIAPSYHEQLPTIQQHKQRNAIAPNVVHSLDAAALMCTIHTAAEAGITHFGMVHDSYGTLAADAATLARCTREAFIALYTENDVVGSLYAQWCAQADDAEKVPPPPMPGTLDLSAIIDSPYFFA